MEALALAAAVASPLTSEQVRDAAPGRRQTLTLHVRLSIPGCTYCHVLCRIWGPRRPATSHVGLGTCVDSPRSMQIKN